MIASYPVNIYINGHVLDHMSFTCQDWQSRDTDISMAAEDLKEVACTAIDRAQACLLRVSDAIWKKPELGFEEHEAHAQLTSILKEYGFLVDEHYTLETAFRARVGDEIQKGIHVAIMCEYDALPGIGHACGHNLIAEAGTEIGTQLYEQLI